MRSSFDEYSLSPDELYIVLGHSRRCISHLASDQYVARRDGGPVPVIEEETWNANRSALSLWLDASPPHHGPQMDGRPQSWKGILRHSARDEADGRSVCPRDLSPRLDSYSYIYFLRQLVRHSFRRNACETYMCGYFGIGRGSIADYYNREVYLKAVAAQLEHSMRVMKEAAESRRLGRKKREPPCYYHSTSHLP